MRSLRQTTCKALTLAALLTSAAAPVFALWPIPRQLETGTTPLVLAAYLVSHGMSAANAIARVRRLRPHSIETEEDSTLPDYYNPVSAIPDVPDRWRWIPDSQGFVTSRADEWMRLYPKQTYTSASDGALRKKLEANMKQMQDTRVICAKIGIVKQMQIQSQVMLSARPHRADANII